MCGTSPGVLRLIVRGSGRLQDIGMSFETSGADYLRRLKRDQDQQPLTYAKPAPAPAPAEPEKQERRRNPRYKCEGSATFRVPDGNVAQLGHPH